MNRIFRAGVLVPLTLVLGAAGCDGVSLGPGSDVDPRNLTGSYSWVFQGLVNEEPTGFPAVQLFWELPSRYRDEVFRVYSRRSSSGGYRLIATVTSCSGGDCTYMDVNVESGDSYDYYVAAVDERDEREVGISDAIRIDVPELPNLLTPGQPSVVSLDNAVFVQWQASGEPLYRLWVDDGGDDLIHIGETDGLSFLDTRAENGGAYTYFVAAVDEFGHVSSLGQTPQAHPRPDYFSEIVYAHPDHPAASGFRFVEVETQDPIVPGASPDAQWRLDLVGEQFQIQPVGQTAITAGVFTTELTCGPGSDADCVDVSTAPPASQFGFAPVEVAAGSTYVLRVVGSDNRVRFGKVRVQGATTDATGRRLVVFDWAYQLRPDEPRLDLVR